MRSNKNEGDTFTVMMARQMGKNELSAHIEAYLLNIYRFTGGTLIKAAPTLRPQALISRHRLLNVLDNLLNRGHVRSGQDAVELGRARARFLSAAPASNVVGGTADLLLELDEAQDLQEDKIQREFRPMASSTNATIVLYGTAWDTTNPLERQKQVNLDRERYDGVRRHFEYDWRVLAETSPPYRAFVEGEIARLGPDHPIVRTQYLLQPLEDVGRLFSPAVRAMLQGSHDRLAEAADGETYVAGIDVAGQDDQAIPGMLATATEDRGRDSTVITIARLRWTDELEPSLEVVQHYHWCGADYPTQHHALRHLLSEVFPCTRIVIDATGLGRRRGLLAGGRARRARGGVSSSSPHRRSRGWDSRCWPWPARAAAASIGKTGARQGDRLEGEIESARYELAANEQMRFFVPESEGHDDFLISLALCCHAATLAPPPPSSAIIPPRLGRRQAW